MTIQVKST